MIFQYFLVFTVLQTDDLKSRLFPKQIFQFPFGRSRSAIPRGNLRGPPNLEVFAEIDSFLIDNRLGNRFMTLAVGGRIIKGTVQANVKILPAMGTFVTEADFFLADLALASRTFHSLTPISLNSFSTVSAQPRLALGLAGLGWLIIPIRIC